MIFIKSTSKIIIFFGLFFLVLSSCKKEKSENVKASLLINKNWKLTAFSINGEDLLTDFYEPCELDNIERYYIDGKITVDEGATKCSTDDPQVTNGTWTLTGDKLTLSQDGLAIKLETNIEDINNTTLKYSLKNPFDPSEIYLYTYTATAK